MPNCCSFQFTMPNACLAVTESRCAACQLIRPPLSCGFIPLAPKMWPHVQVLLSLTDNWQQTGGADEMVRWVGGGLTHEDFFTDTRVKVAGRWAQPTLAAPRSGDSANWLDQKLGTVRVGAPPLALVFHFAGCQSRCVWACMPTAAAVWTSEGSCLTSATPPHHAGAVQGPCASSAYPHQLN